jgi:hypothetical protein
MKTLALAVALIIAALSMITLPNPRRDCNLPENPMPWEVASAAARGCGQVR